MSFVYLCVCVAAAVFDRVRNLVLSHPHACLDKHVILQFKRLIFCYFGRPGLLTFFCSKCSPTIYYAAGCYADNNLIMSEKCCHPHHPRTLSQGFLSFFWHLYYL